MKNPFKLLLTILIFISCAVQAQQSGAIISGNKFLVPRVTRAGITAPQYGWMIYDTVARHYYGYAWPGVWLNLDSSGAGGVGSETDPIFMASAAHTITSTNISNWNSVYNWYNTNGWNSYSPSSFVPVTRTITINGVAYDLSANRTWTVSAVSETDPIYTANGVPKSRILTINGVYYDLSQNRTWTIPDPPNINIGNGFRIGEIGTNNLKTIVAGNGIYLDTIQLPNSIVIGINPATVFGNYNNPDSLGGKPASAYELIVNKVTTLDNSTTHYPSTSAVTTALNDTAAAIRNDFPIAGDTSVFATVIDSTGQPGNRILYGIGNKKIGSSTKLLYDSVQAKLVLGNTNISVGGTATKLYVQGKARITGTITSPGFIRDAGTSSQFLKADGSVDATSYYAASNPNGYISSYTETDPLYTANGVPKTRKITINGVQLDLSADRSWTISAGTGTFAGLTDVALTSPSNGQLVRYNSTTSKWENFTPGYLTSYSETDPLYSTNGASLTGTQTLTNKTLTAPQINSPLLNTSSTVGYVWTATNTSGAGAWQAAAGGGGSYTNGRGLGLTGSQFYSDTTQYLTWKNGGSFTSTLYPTTTMMTIANNSAATTGGSGKRTLDIIMGGANTGGTTNTAVSVINQQTGSGYTTNYGLQVQATGGNENYSIYVPSGGVHIGGTSLGYNLNVQNTAANSNARFFSSNTGSVVTPLNVSGSTIGSALIAIDNANTSGRSGFMLQNNSGNKVSITTSNNGDLAVYSFQTASNILNIDNSGNAVTSTITTAAGTTSKAPVNLPAGTDKTTPVSGDIMNDGATLKYVNSSGTKLTVISGVVVTGTGGVNKYLQTSIAGTTYYIPISSTLPN